MENEPDLIAGSGESWIGKGHQALFRGISTAGAVAVGISASGLSYTGLLPFSTVAGMWPGTELPGILGVALVICLVIGYTYAVIGAAVPRSGADYILASRVLSGPVAFLSSWIFVIISGLAAGSVAAFIPMVLLPTFGRVIAANSGLTGVIGLVDLLQKPQAMALVGTLLVAGTFFFMFVPQRLMIRILSIGAVLILGAWGVFAAAFAVASPDGFSQAWNQVMGAGSFEGVIPAAQSAGYFPVNNLNRMVLAGASLALIIYFGFFATYLCRWRNQETRAIIMAGQYCQPAYLRGSFNRDCNSAGTFGIQRLACRPKLSQSKSWIFWPGSFLDIFVWGCPSAGIAGWVGPGSLDCFLDQPDSGLSFLLQPDYAGLGGGWTAALWYGLCPSTLPQSVGDDAAGSYTG